MGTVNQLRAEVNVLEVLEFHPNQGWIVWIFQGLGLCDDLSRQVDLVRKLDRQIARLPICEVRKDVQVNTSYGRDCVLHGSLHELVKKGREQAPWVDR